MSTAARLLVFGALLAAVFAAAAGAGAALDVERGGEPAAEGGGHGGMAAAEDDHAGEYALRLERGGLRVVDAAGATVSDFDVAHEKELHVIVVRRDLTGFRHLHPTRRPDGSWAADLRPDTPGSYRVFADFEIDGEKSTPSADLQVDGAVRSRPLPPPRTRATVAGLDVALRQDGETFAFEVTRGGRPVAVQDYLGAKGHLVALRASDLEYAHVHADEDALSFDAELPSAGRYRLYLQFQVDGRVHTAEFTVDA